MRNKFPGVCYRCKTRVEKNEGHFERLKNTKGWRLQHADCAIKYRGQPQVQGTWTRPLPQKPTPAGGAP